MATADPSGGGNDQRNPGASAVTSLGRLLWGQGLPPGALVGVARDLWTFGWHTMMAQLAPSSSSSSSTSDQPAGAYARPASRYRRRLPAPATAADRGRYHLYVALTCPWAHRAAIVHRLKVLADAVPLSVAVPGPTGLWEFRPAASGGGAGADNLLTPTADRAGGRPRLRDVYRAQRGGYDGRSTVPLLWDAARNEAVNNESADIIDILNSEFNALAGAPELDLAPQGLQADIARWNDDIYHAINNGVYR